MIFNSLQRHAAAVRSAVELSRDERYPLSTRRAVERWIRVLVEEYAFIDNQMPEGGWAIDLRWPQQTLHAVFGRQNDN